MNVKYKYFRTIWLKEDDEKSILSLYPEKITKHIIL